MNPQYVPASGVVGQAEVELVVEEVVVTETEVVHEATEELDPLRKFQKSLLLTWETVALAEATPVAAAEPTEATDAEL